MTEGKRKTRSFENLTKAESRAQEEQDVENQVGPLSGLNNDALGEPVPQYDKAPSEKVLQNSNNAWIVLGRDRPAQLDSGYGGVGNTGAGAIDIVVGRMGGTSGGPSADVTTGPNFFSDAARIYLSQKTDIDTNFALAGDKQVIGRSGIGIKADAIRIIGREGVKIVSGKAKNIQGAGSGGEKNSQGGKIETIAGISLIAGNDTGEEKLEPIVKAYALNKALLAIVQSIDELSNIVNEMAKSQSQINKKLASHTHEVPQSPAGIQKSLPAIDLAIKVATKEASNMSNVHQNLSKQKNNIKVGSVSDYLDPSGKKWFGSRFNKTN